MTGAAPAGLATKPQTELSIAAPSLRRRVEAALALPPRGASGREISAGAIRIVDGVPGPGDIKVIAFVDAEAAASALAAGALAVLPRDASPALIRLAVDAVEAGFSLLPTELRNAASPHPSRRANEGLVDSLVLTAREREVLRLVAEGASNKEIARRLAISVHTAKFHVGSILAKLDATGRTDAVTQAVRLGLVML